MRIGLIKLCVSSLVMGVKKKSVSIVRVGMMSEFLWEVKDCIVSVFFVWVSWKFEWDLLGWVDVWLFSLLSILLFVDFILVVCLVF